MNESNTVLRPCRESGNHLGGFSVWVLDPEHNRNAAGLLLRSVFFQAAKQNIKWLDWVVHSTNSDSLCISKKLGTEYGVQPCGAWDNKLGLWISLHLFHQRKGYK